MTPKNSFSTEILNDSLTMVEKIQQWEFIVVSPTLFLHFVIAITLFIHMTKGFHTAILNLERSSKLMKNFVKKKFW